MSVRYKKFCYGWVAKNNGITSELDEMPSLGNLFLFLKVLCPSMAYYVFTDHDGIRFVGVSVDVAGRLCIVVEVKISE